jgi:spore germination protein (amino acid permease)
VKSGQISETQQLGPMSGFIIPHTMQISIGILSFQQLLSKNSGQDAWLACLIGGLFSLAIMWMILRLLENEQKFGRADLFSLHQRLFGKWLGGLLNFFVSAHVVLFGVVFLRSYIEILQVWIFPQLSVFTFTILFCLIVWYIVLGGIRIVGGICLLSFIYMIPLYMSTAFAVPEAYFSNLLPMFDHSPAPILISAFHTTHIYLGFELMLYFYPFIKRPQLAKKWCYFGILTSMYIYIILMLMGTVFFSRGEMRLTIWPTITFWKSISFPLLEHVDMIIIVYFMWALLPSVSMSAWIVSRCVKHTFPVIKQKYALVGVLLIFVIISDLIKNGEQVKFANDLYGNIGFFIVYAYIPFLLFYQWLMKKVRGKAA